MQIPEQWTTVRGEDNLLLEMPDRNDRQAQWRNLLFEIGSVPTSLWFFLRGGLCKNGWYIFLGFVSPGVVLFCVNGSRLPLDLSCLNCVFSFILYLT